jgi:hypothetical protein
MSTNETKTITLEDISATTEIMDSTQIVFKNALAAIKAIANLTVNLDGSFSGQWRTKIEETIASLEKSIEERQEYLNRSRGRV